MDLFGIKARKQAKKDKQEQERLEFVKKQKEHYRRKRELVLNWLDNKRKEWEEQRDKDYEEQKEANDKLNNTCPHCNSNDIIQLIKRIKGNSQNSSYNFGSYSHYNSYGNLDTFVVNKCKSCGNEWYHVETKKDDIDCYDPFQQFNEPGLLYRAILEYMEAKYNPYDITEKANSIEEKRENIARKAQKSLAAYRNVPRFMVDYALYQGITEWISRIKDCPKYLKFDYDNTTCYTYEIPDDIWEIVVKLIGWEGEK